MNKYKGDVNNFGERDSVVKYDPEDLSDFVRTENIKNTPVVLTKGEIDTVLNNLEGDMLLIAGLLYDTGLRIMECIRLRIGDVDFHQNRMVVRNGKGNRDRLTMLPDKYKDQLKEKVESSKQIFLEGLENGSDGVYMLSGHERKDSYTKKDWRWQYIFQAFDLSVDPNNNRISRHNFDQSVFHKALKNAVHAAGLTKEVSPHTLRHTFTKHHC